MRKQKRLRVFWLSCVTGGILTLVEWGALYAFVGTGQALWYSEYFHIPLCVAAVLLFLVSLRWARELTKREALCGATLALVWFAAEFLFERLLLLCGVGSLWLGIVLSAPIKMYSAVWNAAYRMVPAQFRMVVTGMIFLSPFLYTLFAKGKPPVQAREEME